MAPTPDRGALSFAAAVVVAPPRCRNRSAISAPCATSMVGPGPVGAPSGVARGDRNVAVVAAFLPASAVPLEQQAVELHDAVDALWIGRCAPVCFGLTAEQRVDAAIAVGRQVGDQCADLGDELGVPSELCPESFLGSQQERRGSELPALLN